MSKVVDTPTLRNMLSKSEANGYNHLLSNRDKARLDPQGFHVLDQSFDHGDGQCIRVMVYLKMKGKTAPAETTLDFDYKDFNRIPEYVGV